MPEDPKLGTSMAAAMLQVEEQQKAQARAEIKARIRANLERLKVDVTPDLDLFLNEISQRTVEAAVAGDELSLGSLGETVEMLTEKHLRNVRDVAKDTISDVLRIVVDTAAAVLSKALLRI